MDQFRQFSRLFQSSKLKALFFFFCWSQCFNILYLKNNNAQCTMHKFIIKKVQVFCFSLTCSEQCCMLRLLTCSWSSSICWSISSCSCLSFSCCTCSMASSLVQEVSRSLLQIPLLVFPSHWSSTSPALSSGWRAWLPANWAQELTGRHGQPLFLQV